MSPDYQFLCPIFVFFNLFFFHIFFQIQGQYFVCYYYHWIYMSLSIWYPLLCRGSLLLYSASLLDFGSSCENWGRKIIITLYMWSCDLHLIFCVMLKLYWCTTGLAPLAAFGWVMATHLSLYPAILIIPVWRCLNSLYNIFSIICKSLFSVICIYLSVDTNIILFSRWYCYWDMVLMLLLGNYSAKRIGLKLAIPPQVIVIQKRKQRIS